MKSNDHGIAHVAKSLSPGPLVSDYLVFDFIRTGISKIGFFFLKLAVRWTKPFRVLLNDIMNV